MKQTEMKRRIRAEAETHPDGCDCQTCKAAGGDKDAMRALISELI